MLLLCLPSVQLHLYILIVATVNVSLETCVVTFVNHIAVPLEIASIATVVSADTIEGHARVLVSDQASTIFTFKS